MYINASQHKGKGKATWLSIANRESVTGGLRPLRYMLMLLMMVVGISEMWGQAEGYYYIANNTDYNSENSAVNWYLVPADNSQRTDKQDAYYSSDNYITPGDPEKPFLTTYKTNRDVAVIPTGVTARTNNSVWALVAVPGESGNYYIIHVATGKYVIYEPPHGAATNRKSMHLQATDAPGENAKFAITAKSPGYNIRPKAITSGNRFLNPASGNKPSYYGQTDNTTPKCYGGIIGLWSGDGDASIWRTESTTSIYTAFPTITNNGSGSFTITASEGDIYYTTDGTDPTTSLTGQTSPHNVTLTVNDDVEVIKAIAKHSDKEASVIICYWLPKCRKPDIVVSNGMVTITPKESDESIFYSTVDGGSVPSTPYSGTFSIGDASIIRAIAKKAGYAKSEESRFFNFVTVHSSSEIINMSGAYKLASDFTSTSSIGSSSEPFKGVIDGQMNTISDLDHPLVAYADGAVIRNVILDNVNISGGTNAGAVCNETTGASCIYNCGVLSGTISGTNAGGIVGKIDGSTHVVNCYSFAEVSGGDYGAGIVGYNSFSSTISDLRTMVMNCMFYGNISSGIHRSPIYGGLKITNAGNLNGYNYYLFDDEAPYSKKASNDGGVTEYNCALAAEKKYLTRFEFFRNVLNSNRELAAWYATGDPDKGKGIGAACEMAKWVLDTSVKPYPILKTQGYYPSVINYEDAPTFNNETLSVSISLGSGYPTGASINSDYPTTLIIFDKDLAHNHFNYRTVRLPYYNEVGTGNCTKNKVVTGWKITEFSGGTQGHFVKDVLDYSGTTHGEDVYPPYNFADRNCTDKDLFSVSGRVFSQGAYYDIPEGVTAIRIEPYWGTAVYLSDPTYDVAYPSGYVQTNAVFVSNMGVRYTGGATASINGDNQTVYTDYATAFGKVSSSGTVYDNAIVLVGNYHHYWGETSPSTSKAFTIMSADLNNDCEPDYSFIVQHGTNRQSISPIRFDFINSPGLGMIQKVETDNAVPSHGIWHPKGWFEVTNTTFIQFSQFEYEDGTTSNHAKTDKSPLILLGGIYDQFVTSKGGVANKTEYIHLGSNVWMKEFCNGTHTGSGNGITTRHIPISVTGGEFGSFYLTGTFQPNVSSVTDNAECYISGGKFGETAGAGQEQLKGDVTWLIDHADITNFYGGGINDQKEAEGNIYIEINNSNVGTFCGGPKFGNMHNDKTVTTKAKNSHFTDFFGAGYGGTSYFKQMTKDETGKNAWNTWVAADYGRNYVSGKGIATNYEYEYFPYSGGESGKSLYVGRLYVNYASLSLAQTKNVDSYLEGCTISGSFYGGGKLGRVDGNVTSTLKDCTVEGNVFGAGYSASVEKVKVLPRNAYMNPQPYYNESVGVFTEGIVPEGEEYTWTQGNPETAAFGDGNEIYTTVDLTTLGQVTGKVTLNIQGNTLVKGNVTENNVTTQSGGVFGGGDASAALGDTEVNINVSGQKPNYTYNTYNVFGGGNLAGVGGNTTVTLQGKTKVLGNVFGGGNKGEVNGTTKVEIKQ